jgi:hypothetical protein
MAITVLYIVYIRILFFVNNIKLVNMHLIGIETK